MKMYFHILLKCIRIDPVLCRKTAILQTVMGPLIWLQKPLQACLGFEVIKS